MKSLALLTILSAAGLCHADPLRPWHLDYEAEIPRTVATRDGTFWIVSYTLTNPGSEPAPLSIGHEIVPGRDPIHRKQSEDFTPDAFLAAFADMNSMKGSNREDLEAAISKLRENRKWFSTNALTSRREIAPGETLHAVAVLPDPRGEEQFSIVVRGLDDPVRLVALAPGLSGLRAVSPRRRTLFERRTTGLMPIRRDEFVWAELPVERDDLRGLACLLDHTNPVVRSVALDLLCRYADPTVRSDRTGGMSPDQAAEEFARARKVLTEWLALQPEIVALQKAAPEERKRFADALEKRDKAMKPVADALRDPGQHVDFKVAEALVDDLFSLDPTGEALPILREIVTSSEFRFDVAKVDSKKPPKELEAWKEWADRFSSTAVWNPQTRAWTSSR